MFVKFTSALALASVAYATETETEFGGHGGDYGFQSRDLHAPQQDYHQPQRDYHQPQRDYAPVHKPAPQGYGHSQQTSSRWERVSTQRPKFVTAYNAEPVDDYYLNLEKPHETITATCEFDFLGYSESSGRITLTQKPGDLVTMIGEFEGMKPGLHALRVHEFGDLEHGCESTGEIYNPFGSPHGHSHFDINTRRVGDIENIQARFDTNAEYKNRDQLLTMWGVNSIIGRSFVAYEREDDFDQTEFPETHNREGRFREGKGEPIGCCVIGLAAKVEEEVEHAPILPIDAGKKQISFHGHAGLSQK